MGMKGEPGMVEEVLPNAMFRVRLDEGREVIAYLGGALKVRHFRIAIGDRVRVKVDPYGGYTTNRIVWRD